MSAASPGGAKRRRWWRRLVLGLILLVVPGYPLAVWLGMPPSWPLDVTLTLGSAGVVEHDRELTPPDDGRRRLVVLQHGLWRSPWALTRLERELEARGYEVLNPGYPSTQARIEEHALRLHDAIEAAYAAGSVDEFYLVGHSMGGLVLQQYLRGEAARAPDACVFLGVPHRGALLCDLRKNWWVFELFMGDQAAMQLSPGDPFHEQAIEVPGLCGTVVGDVGEGNQSVPGNDDGTVAVGEATLADADDSVVLRVGHSQLPRSGEVIRQVLYFLREGKFAD